MLTIANAYRRTRIRISSRTTDAFNEHCVIVQIYVLIVIEDAYQFAFIRNTIISKRHSPKENQRLGIQQSAQCVEFYANNPPLEDLPNK